MTIICMYVR